MPEWVLLLHAGSTWAMVGLIWFVQLVHYPLLAQVGPENYRSFHGQHVTRTGWVVLPLMLVELCCSVTLLIWSLPGALLGSLLLAAIWMSTFALQVPCHRRLEQGFDRIAHRRLVRGNWLRTLLWSGRGALSLYTLSLYMPQGS